MAPFPLCSIGKTQSPDSRGKAHGAHLLMREMSKEFEAII